MTKKKMKSDLDLVRRPRRLRANKAIRESLAEVHLAAQHLVRPIFVQDEIKSKIDIKTMPGQFRHSRSEVLKEIEKSIALGVTQFAIFPVISSNKKDSRGTNAITKNNLAAEVVLKIKKKFPEVILYSDVALDPYTLSGHDGILEGDQILNDETVNVLCEQALILAQAGADFVAPSDMMDGRVAAIRKKLDRHHFQNTGIMSYTAKYASSFYGPFREALGSGLKRGDKKTYQMDFRNIDEAIIEAELDFAEGADMLMVKPAMSYLDIISLLRGNFNIPVTAYQVSGEYAMIKFAAAANAIDEEKTILESLYSIRRAGAALIFSYFADDAAKLLLRQI